MKLTAIRVGTRHRANVGDVTSLAHSISTLGLLHPLVVNGDGQLIAGARRLAAVQSLGWTDAPVRVVRNLSDAISLLKAERDENNERRSFTPSEQVSIAQVMAPVDRDRTF